jgi:hypothetical protein
VSVTRASILLVSSLLLAPIAHAVDGRIEINQASVAASGGFPFVISQPGSYVLTGDLTVADGTTSAIQIGAAGVTLDLNGFQIVGPRSCTPGSQANYYVATTITCAGTGTAHGVTGGVDDVVRNGRVAGFGGYGVYMYGTLASHSVVEDLRVDQNATGGIYLGNGTVRNVNVTLNGGDGITNIPAGDASSATVIEDANISLNKGNGIGLAAQIRGCRISYNGGAGVIHGNAGGQDSSITDSFIYRNLGNAINAYGSYRDSEIYGNGAGVIGGMSDEGGNNVH